MLFRKNIDPRCTYCQRGTQLDEAHIACIKKGIVSPGDHCPSFVYDPMKRVPAQPAVADFSRLKEEDFQIS